ncbi:MAG: alanine racemase [Lachnospirales bacterium]
MNYRDTVLEINMDNAFHNLDILKGLNGNKKVIGVVKANAYGHGLITFSKMLEQYSRVDYLGTATLDEAVALREKGVELPIIVLGGVSPKYLNTAYKYNIILTCHNELFARELKTFGKALKIHIKVDTGMNRIGFKTLCEFNKALKIIKGSKAKITGVYTHFSSADDSEDFTNYQISAFKEHLQYMDEDVLIHCQNTAGSLNFPNLNFVNAIRPGVGIYGINVGFKEIDLRELVTLKTNIVHIKEVDKGEYIGYNRTFKTEKPTFIGTIPIGYGDGFKRCYKGTRVLVNGKLFPIRGNICMDQTIIEVDEYEKTGDVVTLIGENMTIDMISKKTYISPYEILTSLSSRLYKEFYVKGKLILTENQILES